MFNFFKTIKYIFTVFVIAIPFSFALVFLYLHPLNPAFFLGEKLMAATGAVNTASVPYNPINRLAMQLDEKEKQLNEREQSLNDRATALEKQDSIWNNGVLLAIFLALAILGFLVVINFYLDRKRGKELRKLEREKKQENSQEAGQQFL
jgi:hypothetical protein